MDWEAGEMTGQEQLDASLRRAERGDLAAVARTTGEAFVDDPLMTFFYPDDARRADAVERMLGGMWSIVWDDREVYVADDVATAAVWAPPGSWVMSPQQSAEYFPILLGTDPNPAAMPGYIAMGARHPAEPHWFLESVGTLPEQQNRGLGERVLRPVLDRCDRDGLPAWTWSSNARNLPFYERLGFRVLEELPWVDGGPSVWIIRRDAQDPR